MAETSAQSAQERAQVLTGGSARAHESMSRLLIRHGGHNQGGGGEQNAESIVEIKKLKTP